MFGSRFEGDWSPLLAIYRASLPLIAHCYILCCRMSSIPLTPSTRLDTVFLSVTFACPSSRSALLKVCLHGTARPCLLCAAQGSHVLRSDSPPFCSMQAHACCPTSSGISPSMARFSSTRSSIGGAALSRPSFAQIWCAYSSPYRAMAAVWVRSQCFCRGRSDPCTLVSSS